MGANLCCMNQSSSHQQPKEVISNSFDQNVTLQCVKKKEKLEMEKRSKLNPSEKKIARKGEWTLEECLLASPPGPIGGEFRVFKHLFKKVHHPSSPELHTPDFFTPRISFSTEKLGKIHEEDDGDELSVSSMSISRRSGKLKKRVSFRLPEEADIFIF